jgi:uncharacterized protein YndB with AHSA1/START domain
MTRTITVSDVIPAAAAEIYAAWLDSMAHAAMTGGGKATASPEVGAPYSAWDGYINGLNLALNPGKRIEQTWRSTDFNPGDPDSTLTVLLEPAEQGTKVTLVHSGVPDQLADFADGWRQYYFEPMKSYFAALMAPAAAATAPEPAASEPSSPKKPAVRKAAAAKKPAAAKPAAGKKSAAKPAKEAAAKKPAAKARAAAKKSAPRASGTNKAGAKKTAAKKSAAKKPAARKAASRKAAKKAAPRKPAARKPARKSATTKRKGRR